MSSTLTNIALEMVVLIAVALIYYFWQRHRILNGPKDWQTNKLVELHHLAVNCLEPEKFRDLTSFLEVTEKRLSSEDPRIDRIYLERWAKSELPGDVLALISDCLEWLNQSQPKTR